MLFTPCEVVERAACAVEGQAQGWLSAWVCRRDQSSIPDVTSELPEGADGPHEVLGDLEVRAGQVWECRWGCVGGQCHTVHCAVDEGGTVAGTDVERDEYAGGVGLTTDKTLVVLRHRLSEINLPLSTQPASRFAFVVLHSPRPAANETLRVNHSSAYVIRPSIWIETDSGLISRTEMLSMPVADVPSKGVAELAAPQQVHLLVRWTSGSWCDCQRAPSTSADLCQYVPDTW